MDLEDYKEEIAESIEAASIDALEDIQDAIQKAKKSIQRAISDKLITTADPDPTVFLNAMSPADLANYMASRMESMDSLSLDEFKRHLEHSLYPTQTRKALHGD